MYKYYENNCFGFVFKYIERIVKKLCIFFEDSFVNNKIYCRILIFIGVISVIDNYVFYFGFELFYVVLYIFIICI